MDSTIKMRMNHARNELRRIVGIRPDAPPQLVVNALLRLAWDLQNGNKAAAGQVLQAPVFMRPPAVTLQALSHLPYVQDANLATTRAQEQSFPLGAAR